MPSRAEDLQRQISKLQEELDQLLSLPIEPEMVDAIVRFEISKSTGKRGRNPVFTYVAHRTRSLWWLAGNGLGPEFRDGVTWDRLVKWIQAEGGADLELVEQIGAYGTVKPVALRNGSAPTARPRSRDGRAKPQERRGSNGGQQG